MTPGEKQWWQCIRKKGARRFILLYGVGWFGGGMAAFLLWSAYRQGEEMFWFLAPFIVFPSVICGVTQGGFVWLLYDGRYKCSHPNEEDRSQPADQ